jgi:hypothetical protein
MSSSPPLLNGPIPPYNNPPIEPQNFKPSRFEITNVTLGPTTFVTTSVDLNYDIGQECRLIIPQGYGCRQLNEKTGIVLSIPDTNQVELSIESIGFDPFIAANLRQQPAILAIGDINTGATNIYGRYHLHTTIPGAFKNISPKPPL